MDVEAYLGEIRIFAFNYAPKDWKICNGEILTITSNTALYSLLGIAFGGDGRTTFALPDMRCKLVAMYNNSAQGTTFGTFKVTLTQSQLFAHTHYLYGTNSFAIKRMASPAGTSIAQTANGSGTPGPLTPVSFTMATTNPVVLNTDCVGDSGGSIGHSNIMPTIALNYCIALNGIYPPREDW